MLPFRTEIRNSPKEQTLKIYMSDLSLDQTLKTLLEKKEGVRRVEIQDSISRNRVAENITVFAEEGQSVNRLKEKIDAFLNDYFSKKEA
jgi:DNA-directed RNA polymerase subunit L